MFPPINQNPASFNALSVAAQHHPHINETPAASQSLCDRINSCSRWISETFQSCSATVCDLWEHRAMLSPTTHFSPGKLISADPLYKDELRTLRNQLRSQLSGLPIHLGVQRNTSEERFLDGMLFNVDYVDTLQNPNLAEGKRSIYKDGRPTVILFGGNASFYEENPEEIDYYLSQGFNVMAFNYSGYGESQGSPSQKTLDQDAEAIFQEVKRQCPNEEKIVLHGHSIVGGIASKLAKKHPSTTVILERSFARIQDIVPNFLRSVGNNTMRNICNCVETCLVEYSKGYCNYNNRKALKNVRRVYMTIGACDDMMGEVSSQKLRDFCSTCTSSEIKRKFVMLSKNHVTTFLRPSSNRRRSDEDLMRFNSHIMDDLQKELGILFPINSI
ncbi:MAG: hypothetical protein ACI9S8_001428 [Chlamydiales bacterium]|jgi:hypothetical protein